MELVNCIYEYKDLVSEQNNWVVGHSVRTLLVLMAPFVPYLAEELWERIGESTSVHLTEWLIGMKKHLNVMK